MTIMDHFPSARFTILGTDIDANVLTQAKNGVSKQNDFAKAPPLKFYKSILPLSDKGYQIKDTSLNNTSPSSTKTFFLDRFQSGL